MESTYLRYKRASGRYVPFAPPIHSPKHTGPLPLKHRIHYWGWRLVLPVWTATVGQVYAVQNPILLLGCHNSGTTILERLLGEHRDLVDWSEAPEVWAPDDAFLNWSVIDQPVHDVPFLFAPHQYQRTVEAHAQYIQTIRDVFTLFAFSRGKRRFLNKNPHMSTSVPYIEEVFPQACYVYIRRHGAAVTDSLLHQRWRQVLADVKEGKGGKWNKLAGAIDPIYFEDPLAFVRLCARYWQEIDTQAAAQLAPIDRARVFVTTYEELCAHPEDVIRAIFRQFGFAPHRYPWKQLKQPTRYPWTEMLPIQNQNHKYKQRLTPAELGVIQEEIGEHLQAHGYTI